jgi:pimeloyl-ACP methyl ester carboxylesterase
VEKNDTRRAAVVLWAILSLPGCGDSGPGTVAVAPRATGDAGPTRVPQTHCGQSSWVAGVTEWCDGRLLYRDYIYDDYGADSGAPSASPFPNGTLAGTAGDARYPAGAENTADLVRLELRADRDRIHVEAELNALYATGQTVLHIALDTDGQSGTGGGAWPGLAIRSEGWDAVYRFDHGDPAGNLITGSFPRPAAATWKVWAVTAQADGTVMNVAFRGPHEKAELLGAFGAVPTDVGAFWEDRQAAALGAGDITLFAANIASADFDRRTTRGAEVGPGLHQRVYTSAYALPPGEGVSLAGVGSRINPTNTGGSQQFNFLGRYQPYGYYAPAGSGPHGLQVKLHGLGSTHASIISSPGFQRDFGEDLNRVIVAPLGRGVVGCWSDIAERDALDVLDDALAHLDVDPEQVTISGYSMGGYGALRLAMLYPHRFAALVNWVGPTGDDTNTPLPGNPLAVDVLGQAGAGSFVGNMVDFAGNLLNLPSVHLYGGADETPNHAGHPLTLGPRLLEAQGVEHDFYLHPTAEHFTFALADQWEKEAAFTAGRVRARTPSRVRFRTDESFRYPEYGLRHDRAYWVSGIRARDSGYADVDVGSRGCAMPARVFETGNDFGVGPEPLAWQRQYRRVAGEQAAPPENRIEAVLANVAALSIDRQRACLHAGGLRYKVSTDGPVTIDFGPGVVLQLPSAGVYEGVL